MLRLHRGSVLPRVFVERTREGTLLRAALPTGADLRGVIVYGIAFLAVFAVAFLPKGGISGQIARFTQAAAFFSVFFGALTTYLRRRRLFRATLLLPHWPLHLGDTVQARFRAMLKKSARVTEVAAKLQCVENVVIGGGRDVRKPTAVIYELDLPCAKSERQVIDEEWTLTIPAGLPTSYDVALSKVEWRVTALLGEVPADFLLLVTPR